MNKKSLADRALTAYLRPAPGIRHTLLDEIGSDGWTFLRVSTRTPITWPSNANLYWSPPNPGLTMAIDDLYAVATVVFGISLATERLVAIVKTACPEFFADEKKTPAKEVDLVADRWRRLSVQGLAFVIATCTAAFLAEGSSKFCLPGWCPVGVVALDKIKLPAPLLGLLASGGSAFWAQVVGYASAVKDIRVQERAIRGLDYQAQAAELGVQPQDSGLAAKPKGLKPGALLKEKQVYLSTQLQIQPDLP